MTNIRAGAPYFMICKKCNHRFIDSRNNFITCPKCRSIRVIVDKAIEQTIKK